VNDLYLAILAGFLATTVAGIVRNRIMTRVGAEPDHPGIPVLVIVYSAIASLAGSAAALEGAEVSKMGSSALIGTLARPFSSILMAMLMITYHMHPDAPRKRH